MDGSPRLPDARLISLYDGYGFGGDRTMRAKVIRELIDEIRDLRKQVGEMTVTRPQSSAEEP